jgi:hypothetical protein
MLFALKHCEETIIMWIGFQLAIIFAVIASNIHWQWTPNGYVAGLSGLVTAFLATVALSTILKLWRGEPIRLPPNSPEKRAADRREGNAIVARYVSRFVALCLGAAAFNSLVFAVFGDTPPPRNKPFFQEAPPELLYLFAAILALAAVGVKHLGDTIASWLARSRADRNMPDDHKRLG